MNTFNFSLLSYKVITELSSFLLIPPCLIIFAFFSVKSITVDLEKKINNIIGKSITNKIIFDAIIPQNLKQYNNIWKTRELLSEAQKLNGKSIKHDISIPVEKIPLFIKKARKFLTDFRKNNILIFGHLAEGNLHYNISKPKTMSMSVFNKLHKKVNSNIFNLVPLSFK